MQSLKSELGGLSVVTPTLRRPHEVLALLDNISLQSRLPVEMILVDGAPSGEDETERAIKAVQDELPFVLTYLRHPRGTAIQRNAGINRAGGEFVALIDDDVRLEKGFFETVLDVFAADIDRQIGAVVGYRTNCYFKAEEMQRWRWYRKLGLLKTFEPGRYDYRCGYPINANMQPPFSGIRPVDFMTTACAVWRREVFDSGLRFHPFFTDYGVLEDAHFSLRASRRWQLVQCGDAHCQELSSPNGRSSRRKIGYKCVVNYYFVFNDIAGPLSADQQFRFWRFQCFELFRMTASWLRRRRAMDLQEVVGRCSGIFDVLRGVAIPPAHMSRHSTI